MPVLIKSDCELRFCSHALRGQIVTGLLIFTGIAVAGCAFLLYFIYALWRDDRSSRKGSRVEVRRLPDRKIEKGKLLRMYRADELQERKRL